MAFKRVLASWLYWIVALAIIISSEMVAQGLTTGAIRGVVSAAQGPWAQGPIPRAEIIITDLSTRVERKTISQSDGSYAVFGLPVGGPYRILFSAEGFGNQIREPIYLTLSQTQSYNVKLEDASISMEPIVVTGERDAIINPSRNGAATFLKDEQIRYLPTLTRNFTEYAKLSPQMIGNNAAGRHSKFNFITIDGVVNNDVYGLAATGTPGGQIGSTPISMDAIQEFEVQIAPYDIRLGLFTGASINAVTRRGSNDLHGAAYSFFRNETLIGQTSDGVKPTETRKNVVGARLGGTIIPNQLFYFVSLENERDVAPTGFGLTGKKNSTDFPGSAPFLSLDTAKALQSFMKSQFGYDPGNFGVRDLPTNSFKLFTRLDYALGKNHYLTIRNNFVKGYADILRREPGTSSSVAGAGFKLSNGRVQFNDENNSTTVLLHSQIAPNVSNEFQLNGLFIRDYRKTPGPRFPYVLIKDVNAPGYAYVAGTEQFATFNDTKQRAIELTDNVTYVRGPHTIVAGMHHEFAHFDASFYQDINGRYEFNSFTQFKQSAQGAPGQVALFTVRVPINPTTFLPDSTLHPTSAFDVTQWGFYAQDVFRVMPTLTLTAGVRADIPTYGKTPVQNDTFALNYPGSRTDRLPDTYIQWSPRLGFNWDVRGDQTLQLRGGVGIFSGRNPYIWFGDLFNNSGSTFSAYTSNAASLVFNPDPLHQVPVGGTAIPQISVIDKNYKHPQVLRANFGWDQVLPLDMIATVDILATNVLYDPIFENISLQGIQSYDVSDGRPRFGTVSTYPGSLKVTPLRRTLLSLSKQYGDVIRMKNTNNGYQYHITEQLQKKWPFGLMVMGAYTWSRSVDVSSNGSNLNATNWSGTPHKGDPNHLMSSTSVYEQRHSLLASVLQSVHWPRGQKSTISLIYTGRSGRPYSTTYSGDFNADGNARNDLIYVPKDKNDIILVPSSSSDTRTADQIWVELDEYIVADPALRHARGHIIDRNASYEEWFNRVDLKLAHEITRSPKLGSVELSLDILNVGHLLNESWGESYNVVNQLDQPLVFRGLQSGTNRPIFSFTTRKRFALNTFDSRWQMMFGVRYTF